VRRLSFRAEVVRFFWLRTAKESLGLLPTGKPYKRAHRGPIALEVKNSTRRINYLAVVRSPISLLWPHVRGRDNIPVHVSNQGVGVTHFD
jgi:hypothetical protein